MTEVPPAADLTPTDDLLADIDAILEEQGEDFAINYRQQGGQ